MTENPSSPYPRSLGPHHVRTYIVVQLHGFFVPSTLSSRSDFCTLYGTPICRLHEIQKIPKKPKIGQKGPKKLKSQKYKLKN
jgi:hypothetical protein